MTHSVWVAQSGKVLWSFLNSFGEKLCNSCNSLGYPFSKHSDFSFIDTSYDAATKLSDLANKGLKVKVQHSVDNLESARFVHELLAISYLASVPSWRSYWEPFSSIQTWTGHLLNFIFLLHFISVSIFYVIFLWSWAFAYLIFLGTISSNFTNLYKIF